MRVWILCGIFALIVPLSFAQPNSARSGNFGGPAPLNNRDDITENFDDITTLPGDGWVTDLNPDAAGTITDFFQGNPAVFPAHMGATDAYIAANFNMTGGSQISSWLMTPVIDFDLVDTVSFWTRTAAASTFPDRMQVRASTNGASTNVGTGVLDEGDFTTLLEDINPTLAVGGYPEDWTQFTFTGADLPSGMGRLAFRYFVPTDAGPFGNNSNFIGIDTFELIEISCDLSSISLVGNQLTVTGNCPDGADIYVIDANGVPTLIAAGVAVNGSTTLTLPDVLPDSFYGVIAAGGDPADIVILTQRTVPTLGEWGMAAFVIGLAFMGIFMMRRRQAMG